MEERRRWKKLPYAVGVLLREVVGEALNALGLEAEKPAVEGMHDLGLGEDCRIEVSPEKVGELLVPKLKLVR